MDGLTTGAAAASAAGSGSGNGNFWGSLGGAIPVVGGIAQGIINAVNVRKNQERQNRANRELAEYSYSKDLEMWNRGNEYNAPMAQMDRLKKAGLNPNLVYGSGAVAGQTAGQIPKYQAPQLEYSAPAPVDAPQTIGAYQDFQIRNAQLDNLRAQRNAINTDTLIKSIEAEARPDLLEKKRFGMGLENYWKNFLYQSKEIQERRKASIMSKDRYEDYTLEGMRLKNRSTERSLDKMLAEIAGTNAKTELTKLGTDMFMTAFWAKQVGAGAGLLKDFFKRGGGRAGQTIKNQTFRGTPQSVKGSELKKASERIKTWNKKYGTRPGWKPYTKD